MNNFNFSRNPFNGAQNETKIAGGYVQKNSDGGRMSLDEVRENMNGVKNPKVSNPIPQPISPPIPNANLKTARDRVQSLRDVGRK